jgi:peptidoglycan/LPS O-acetylase OafA/YrhL
VIPPIFGSYLGAELFFMFVAFVPTFIIGGLSWHLYEKQVLKLKRFFPYAKRDTPELRDAQAATIAPALGGGD